MSRRFGFPVVDVYAENWSLQCDQWQALGAASRTAQCTRHIQTRVKQRGMIKRKSTTNRLKQQEIIYLLLLLILSCIEHITWFVWRCLGHTTTFLLTLYMATLCRNDASCISSKLSITIRPNDTSTTVQHGRWSTLTYFSLILLRMPLYLLAGILFVNSGCSDASHGWSRASWTVSRRLHTA